VELNCPFSTDLEHQMTRPSNGLGPTVLDDRIPEALGVVSNCARLFVTLRRGMYGHFCHQGR
jgi:hypothetical protein